MCLEGCFREMSLCLGEQVKHTGLLEVVEVGGTQPTEGLGWTKGWREVKYTPASCRLA